MGTIGFLLIKNNSKFDEQQLLEAIKRFHNEIPLEEKEDIKLKHFN